jgi:hypothetical protein
MPAQPTFTKPGEAIAFLHRCLAQNDPDRLYAAFTEPISDFWQERIFQCLQAIDQAETLECVFLEDGKITAFPEQDTVMHLGGHGPRTHYIHLKLTNIEGNWHLASIHVCR